MPRIFFERLVILYYTVVGGKGNLVNGSVKQKPILDTNPTDNGHDVYKHKYLSWFVSYIIWIVEHYHEGVIHKTKIRIDVYLRKFVCTM